MRASEFGVLSHLPPDVFPLQFRRDFLGLWRLRYALDVDDAGNRQVPLFGYTLDVRSGINPRRRVAVATLVGEAAHVEPASRADPSRFGFS